MNTNTKKIAYTGLFIALSIILTRFFSGQIMLAGAYALRISFGEIPIILSGILFGPLYGFLTGALADILGYPLNPAGGAFFPGFTLSAGLTGMLPGLMAKFNRREWSWLNLIIVICITDIITGLFLNTLWLNMITGRAFMILLPPRLISRLFLIPMYVIIIKTLLRASTQFGICTD